MDNKTWPNNQEEYVRGNAGGDAVAAWDPALVRYIILDGDNGDDSHAGYLMAPPGAVFDPAETFTVAVKTTHRINQLRPPVGAGRMVVVLIKPRANAAVYDHLVEGDGLGQDDRSLCTGYALMLTRGSDLTNSLADRKQLGLVTAVTGPNEDGSFTVAGVGGTPGNVTVSLAPAVLPVSPILVQYQARIALAAGGEIATPVKWGDPSADPDRSVLSTWFMPGPVAPGDHLWLETPGATLASFTEAAEGSSLCAAGLRLTGRLTVGALSPVFATYTHVSVDVAGGSIEHHAPGTDVEFTSVFTDETGGSVITTGLSVSAPGNRQVSLTALGGEVIALYCNFSMLGAPMGPPARVAGLASFSAAFCRFEGLDVDVTCDSASLENCLLGNVSLAAEKNSVSACTMVPTWWTAPIALGFGAAPGLSSVPTADVECCLSGAQSYWGNEPEIAGYLLRPGQYKVLLNLDNPHPGAGLDVMVDPTDPTRQIHDSYASLALTGFEIVGGQKVVCRSSTAAYHSHVLPCPRGTVMRMVDGDVGGLAVPVGMVVGSMGANPIGPPPGTTEPDRFDLAQSTQGGLAPTGALLTNTVQPGTEHVGVGYAVVSADSQLVLRLVNGDVPAPGTLLYLSATTAGLCTVTYNPTLSWKIAVTLSEGSGVVGGNLHFSRFDPDLTYTSEE